MIEDDIDLLDLHRFVSDLADATASAAREIEDMPAIVCIYQQEAARYYALARLLRDLYTDGDSVEHTTGDGVMLALASLRDHRRRELVAMSLWWEQDGDFDSIPTIARVYRTNPSPHGDPMLECPFPHCVFRRRDPVKMWRHVHFRGHREPGEPTEAQVRRRFNRILERAPAC